MNRPPSLKLRKAKPLCFVRYYTIISLSNFAKASLDIPHSPYGRRGMEVWPGFGHRSKSADFVVDPSSTPSGLRFANPETPSKTSFFGGLAGICTRVRGFADRCLTTRPPDPIFKSLMLFRFPSTRPCPCLPAGRHQTLFYLENFINRDDYRAFGDI